MLIAPSLLCLCVSYLACGLLFAVAFVTVGVGQVDAAARGTSLGFRLLIFPGATALWPLLAIRWLRARRQGANP